MPFTSLRLREFKCFADSGPIRLAPLTLPSRGSDVLTAMIRRPFARSALFALLLAPPLVLGCDKPKRADEVPASECPAFTAAGRLPSTLGEVAAAKEKGATWSNREIRARYICWAAGIGAQNEQWKSQGLSVEERAKRAYQTRHDARVVSRAMMSSPDEIKALEDRDRAKYGTPDGPTFDWLVKRAEEKGLHGEAVFEEIVTSSQRTDQATNAALGL